MLPHVTKMFGEEEGGIRGCNQITPGQRNVIPTTTIDGHGNSRRERNRLPEKSLPQALAYFIHSSYHADRPAADSG